MLELHRPGFFGRTISVRLNGHELATIKDKAFWEGSQIVIEGVQYELTRTGFMSGDYVLRRGGEELARGRKPSFVSRRIQAELAGEVYELVPSAFTSKYSVERFGEPIGSIGPRPVIRSYPVLLPPDMPTIYQVFLVALAALMWARTDD